jgi:hypothetical protein
LEFGQDADLQITAGGTRDVLIKRLRPFEAAYDTDQVQ